MSILKSPSHFDRRRFLQGLGVSIALPGFTSLGTSQLAAAETSALNLATTPTGAVAHSICLFSQRCHTWFMVAF